ncbi:SnoaL-like domain-containing protein [Nakamurella panacisegetis]|uniref:SnoaL-like domain-containing protein n=1 Tax=Nakamurella panacisegetis TaxID=1090615 RepID=A0A1H0RB16_9ACTN|nr:nuclear transport factor 2 family protein [Nakamurella panacisegetis]SDP26707.1 SnoaL-like domain-containing protein [Nakamurella panacisegetis]
MTHGTALTTALAYFQASAAKDIDHAMSFLADEIVCDAPAGRIQGAVGYRAFLESFSKLLKHSELVASFGDDHEAILLYDNDTVPVPSAPSAGHFTVVDGRITHIRFIFDRVPYEAAARAAQAAN